MDPTLSGMFAEMDRLRQGIDRFLGTEAWNLPFSRVSFLPGRAARAYPLVNLSETGEGYRIEALAPGLDAESLDITVTGDTLSISGAKAPLPDDVQPEQCHRLERSGGRFHRTIQLETEIDRDRVNAEYKNGILTIDAPKAEAARARRIPIATD